MVRIKSPHLRQMEMFVFKANCTTVVPVKMLAGGSGGNAGNVSNGGGGGGAGGYRTSLCFKKCLVCSSKQLRMVVVALWLGS